MKIMKNRVLFWFPLSLWILSILVVTGFSEKIPGCGSFYYQMNINEKGNRLISFIAPNTSAQNGFVLKVMFKHDQSEEQFPKLVATSSQHDILNAIVNGLPVSYEVKCNSSTKLDVRRIQVDDRIVCDDNWRRSPFLKKVQVQFKFKPPKGKQIILTSTLEQQTSYYVSKESCGIEIAETLRYQNKFPWIAKVYISQKFECFANFISKTRAVTVSYCLKEGVQANEIHLWIFSSRYVSVRGYKKHPDSGLVILETESIDEVNFFPACLTNDPVLVGTHVFNVIWNDWYGVTITNGTVTTKDECNNNELSISEHEFCLSSNLWSQYGRGIFTKKDERWFLRGVINHHTIRFYSPIDVSKFFSFITGNHSIDSFDSFTNTQKFVSIVPNYFTLDHEDGENDLFVNLSSYSDSNCGIPYSVSPLMRGGKLKFKKKWPWVAPMYVNQSYACTASFISRTRAITAAHCLRDDSKDIKLRIFTGQNISVKSYKIHPSYVNVPKYDIAILDTERVDNENFVPVCLTDDNTSLVGHRGSILSWAPNPMFNDSNEEMLFGEDFSIVHRMYCKNIVQQVPNHTFCVNQGHNGTIFCLGDSGSGFMMRYNVQNDKRYFLRGVVSTGLTVDGNNCTIGDSVIFTDVTKLLSFVKES